MKKIYYKKSLPIKRAKVANFKGISEDYFSKTVPVDFAAKQENLMVVNGVLVGTQYPKDLGINFDQPVKNVFPIYQNGVMLFCDLGSKVCILSTVNGEIVRTEFDISFDIYSATYYKYGEQSFLILATSDGLKKFENGAIVDTEVDVRFEFICNHFYRIFASRHNSTRLEFSDDFAPFNWNTGIEEGGYINLPFERGNIICLMSFNQNLIVCQEDGFLKITAYSVQEDFLVKTISSPACIKKGSVADCGDFIMYATEKGLGIFDGYDHKLICEELAGILKKCQVEVAKAAEYCYFLCKFSDMQKDNLIIAFNLVKKNYHIITCDEANKIFMVKVNGEEKLLILYTNFLKMLSDDSNSANKVWKSGVLDFDNPAEYKLLKNIEFGGKTILDLKINVDGRNYFFIVSQHKRSFLLNLKGKEFEIEIVPKGRTISLPSPVLEYQVLEE